MRLDAWARTSETAREVARNVAQAPVVFRQKRLAPCRRSFGPPGTVERHARQGCKLFLPPPFWQRREAHTRGSGPVFSERARRQHDADRLLHTLEDARRHVRLVAFRRTIDDPDIGAVPAQVFAHLLKAGAVQEARHRDEADDALASLSGSPVIAA